jgi:hypothetical protein
VKPPEQVKLKIPAAMREPLARLRAARLRLVEGVNRWHPNRTTPEVTAALGFLDAELQQLADAAATAPPSADLGEAITAAAEALQALATAYQSKAAAPGAGDGQRPIRGQQEQAA